MDHSIHRLAARQHGVVSIGQLFDLGFSADAIKHRVAAGVLWPVHRGVYAVGRPSLSRHGRWMAAVLSCGSTAALSHRSAAALWQIADVEGAIEVATTAPGGRRRPGLVVHRRRRLDVVERDGIPVTTIVTTLLDLAQVLPPGRVETALNEADRQDLIDIESLRETLDRSTGKRGVRVLRMLVGDHRPTDSWLERRFLRLVTDAGLPRPLTQQVVNGFRVDFWWPQFRLVVETDGLRYHRTPAQQTRDRERDQAHVAAGLTVLRFTYEQIRADPARVVATLRAVALRDELGGLSRA